MSIYLYLTLPRLFAIACQHSAQKHSLIMANPTPEKCRLDIKNVRAMHIGSEKLKWPTNSNFSAKKK